MQNTSNVSVLVIGVLLALVIGIGAGYLIGSTAAKAQKITSFEECVAAGNPVMESYPEQCRTADGQLFVRDISNDTNNTDDTSEVNDGGDSMQQWPAMEAVRDRVASDFGIDRDTVDITRIEMREWSDGCLGLGGPAESCMQMIVEGYAVTVEVNGETHTYRTNQEGTEIRKQP